MSSLEPRLTFGVSLGNSEHGCVYNIIDQSVIQCLPMKVVCIRQLISQHLYKISVVFLAPHLYKKR